MKPPLVIIGSGLAAYLLAKEFRQYDSQRLLMILTESEGHFYSKPLLSTALTRKQSIKKLIIAEPSTMSDQLSALIVTHARVTSIHPDKKTVCYETGRGKTQFQNYSDLVLACGAHKNTLALKMNAKDICSVNNIEDYRVFRRCIFNKKHIGVIGGGLVACEFANDLINAGYQVSVIMRGAFPLSTYLPSIAGRYLAEALKAKGVRWLFSHSVQSVHKDKASYVVTSDSNQKITFDAVLSAVGITPNIKLAADAGIETRKGIVVDQQLRSSHPNIYALGDCAEVNQSCFQYIAPLMQSARILAKVLVGERAYLQYPLMPIVVKTPACPIVFVLPGRGAHGRWCVDPTQKDLKMSFRDNADRLKGFVLMGSLVKEKNQLMQEISTEKGLESAVQ